MSDFFKPIHVSSKSKARLGKITTGHGMINTPSFVAVGTKGTIKALTPPQVKEIGTQVAFVNTYHLVTHPGPDIIAESGGIHKYSKLDIPLMSDSGGFQVFSLAKDKRTQHSNFLSPLEPTRSREVQSRKKLNVSSPQSSRKADVRGDEQPILVKISDDGVQFRSIHDGQLIEFTPEKSMEYQAKIGADINMAFDECTYYPATHEYSERAMERTHDWLKRCIAYNASADSAGISLPASARKLRAVGSPPYSATYRRYLYGIIQGGTFEDLRKKSAEFVVSQDTSGVAIGGVSVGESKNEMRDQVKWVADYLPPDRPVHLLGVGHMDDIIDLVKYGIDTFDCVEPTRLARMGTLYKISNIRDQISNKGKQPEIDITKSVFRNNLEKVDEDCDCYTCSNFTKSYLHHLFKQREILGYTLATIHNLTVMEKLFEKIRAMIGGDLI